MQLLGLCIAAGFLGCGIFVVLHGRGQSKQDKQQEQLLQEAIFSRDENPL